MSESLFLTSSARVLRCASKIARFVPAVDFTHGSFPNTRTYPGILAPEKMGVKGSSPRLTLSVFPPLPMPTVAVTPPSPPEPVIHSKPITPRANMSLENCALYCALYRSQNPHDRLCQA